MTKARGWFSIGKRRYEHAQIKIIVEKQQKHALESLNPKAKTINAMAMQITIESLHLQEWRKDFFIVHPKTKILQNNSQAKAWSKILQILFITAHSSIKKHFIKL